MDTYGIGAGVAAGYGMAYRITENEDGISVFLAYCQNCDFEGDVYADGDEWHLTSADPCEICK